MTGTEHADRAVPSRERLVPATFDNFDEAGYLAANSDVEHAVRGGFFPSGRRHFQLHGHAENRLLSITDPVASAGRAGVLARFRRPAGAAAGPDTDRRLERLEERVYDLQVAVTQLGDMLRLGYGAAPPPPKHLQQRVVGSYTGTFIRSGFESVLPLLNRVLAHTGRRVEDFQRVLDFGCGSGRAVFALHTLAPDVDLHATDVDPEAIHWLQANWPDFATYAVCPTEPPMPYAEATFDFVFGISVMTHLPEDLHLRWLGELRRVTRPGGYVLLTTHGEHAWRGQLDDAQTATMERSGFLYTVSGYGARIGLPDFYETAYHSHDYIGRVWTQYFEVIGAWPPEPGEHQDSVLLRRPPGSESQRIQRARRDSNP